MPSVVGIDVMPAWRKMPAGELADRVGITPANLAVLKNGRATAVRFATLAALCEVLDCRPGDLLHWEAEDEETAKSRTARPRPHSRGRRGPATPPPRPRAAAPPAAGAAPSPPCRRRPRPGG